MKESSILVVEDEMIISMEIRATLKKLGYIVAGSVVNGYDAVQTAGEKRPDLVLMDIRLKGDMDGIEAAKKIMELYDIPVIFLTGNSDKNTVERAVAIKPAGFLVKPFKERELFGNIEMAIHKHKVKARINSDEKDKSSDICAKKLSSLDTPLISADKNGVITRANPSAVELIGKDKKEIINRKISEVFDTTSEPEKVDDINYVLYAWPDTMFIKKSGSRVFVHLSSGFIEDSLKEVQDFIFSLSTDKETPAGKENLPAHFASIMNSFTEAIFITDASMNILYYNDNFQDLLKRLGTSLFQLKIPLYQIRELSAFVEADEYVEVFRTNLSISKIKKLKSRNKEDNFFKISLIPASDENRVTSVTTVIEDITSLVNAKEHTRYITRNLEDIKESLSMVNSIVAGISSPLEAIKRAAGGGTDEYPFGLINMKTKEIEDLIESFNVYRMKYENAIDHVVFMDKTSESW